MYALLFAVTLAAFVGQGKPPLTHAHPVNNGNNIHFSLQDRAGNLWFASTDQGVYRYDGKTMAQYTTKEGLCHNAVWQILEATDGTIWLGTSAGACKYQGGKFTHVPIINNIGPAPITVYSIMQDRAGAIWFGTDFNGVYRYNGQVFARFLDSTMVRNPRTHLNTTLHMLEDKQGNVWFASWAQEGINKYDGNQTLSRITMEDGGGTDNMIHSILEDSKGNLWFGSRNNGVYRYENGKLSNFTLNTPLNQSAIYGMIEDRNGHIWFGTEADGAWRYDGKAFTQYTAKDGLGNTSVFSIVEDRAGNLWFGTRNVSLYRYDGKTFTLVIEDGAVL